MEQDKNKTCGIRIIQVNGAGQDSDRKDQNKTDKWSRSRIRRWGQEQYWCRTIIRHENKNTNEIACLDLREECIKYVQKENV